ncbi:MAG TPA: sigma-70 family RNA polymerase sigma factor [Kofleriaceae bacterium]|nr:sigma-70 family RNA polymerase sigma factor [Kofleriaceae bacterium]
MDGYYSSLFLGELDAAKRQQLESIPDLESRLASIYDAGRAAFQEVVLDAPRLMRHLAAIVDDTGASLDALHVTDLYLACACAHGDPNAVGILEREFISTLDAPLRSTGLDAHAVDDVRQRVREVLLVGSDHVPGIASYRGKGQLRSWLRAVAVRQAMMHFRGKRETPVDDNALEGLAEIGADAQLAPWKRQYAAAFREAFEHSVKALSEHERMLLRQHHLDQLSIDELATLHKVHRATAARQVASARAALLTRLRARMIEKLAISGGDLDSALRLARSQLDVSMHRLLGGKRQRKT